MDHPVRAISSLAVRRRRITPKGAITPHGPDDWPGENVPEPAWMKNHLACAAAGFFVAEKNALRTSVFLTCFEAL
jgi:hypothetical protein